MSIFKRWALMSAALLFTCISIHAQRTSDPHEVPVMDGEAGPC